MSRRLVLPGDHLTSAEEAEPGQNTYTEGDEVFSATMGEDESEPGRATVRSKTRNLPSPEIGMEVYGVVIKSSPNKAIIGCIPVSEAEGQGRGLETEAVIPVTAVRRGYVNDMRDEVKIGDIVRAKIKSVEKTGLEATLQPKECGIVACFCPRDRTRMDLHDTLFVCPACNWKERRKLVGTDEGGERGGGFRSREGGFRDRGPPRGGFRGREGGRGFRPREGGFRDRGPPRGRGYPPRGPHEGGFGSRESGAGEYPPREGGFRPREGFAPREGEYGQREGGFQEREGFRPREREGNAPGEGFVPRERQFEQRESEGYAPKESREGGYAPGAESGFRPREREGYNPREGYPQREGYPRREGFREESRYAPRESEGGYNPRQEGGYRERRFPPREGNYPPRERNEGEYQPRESGSESRESQSGEYREKDVQNQERPRREGGGEYRGREGHRHGRPPRRRYEYGR